MLTLYFFAFTSCIPLTSALVDDCSGKPLCHVVDEHFGDIKVTDVNKWRTFCYSGHIQSLRFLWLNPQLSVKFHGNTTPSNFLTLRGTSRENVESQQSNMNMLLTLLQRFQVMMFKERETVSFTAFNYSCVGIYSDTPYTASMVIKMIDFWLVAYMGAGLLLFLSAKSWSRNTSLHYGAGISIGVMASLIILAFILHRIFPQSIRKVGYVLLAVGCSASLCIWTYLTQYLISPATDKILVYWREITGYVIIMGLVSFAVVYKYGPISDQRTLRLLQWFLQLLGLVLIYNGTQITEVSVAIIVVVLFLYNLRLPTVLSNSKFFIYLRYKLWCPKIRLLTEEEYQQEANECTKKALEELQIFCRSPQCDAWRTISRLQDPSRFASFVEGQSWHVTDAEILDHDDSGEGNMPVSNDDYEEDEDEEEISGEPLPTETRCRH